MTETVVVSLEQEAQGLCVEFLRIDEDGFAFRQCERVSEAGWRKVPQRVFQVFPSYWQALQAARNEVEWLNA